MRSLDLGIAAYGNPSALERAVTSVRERSTTAWRLLIVCNRHPDDARARATFDVASRLAEGDPERIFTKVPSPHLSTDGLGINVGYPGAVNEILHWAQTEYVAYLDHDVTLHTAGWDETMTSVLDRFHEIGMLFPGWGPYPIDRGPYVEILWGVGCCWMIPRRILRDIGLFDRDLGHHEEVDFATRVRLYGLKIAAAKDVSIHHAAEASSDPAAQERIAKGVEKWVNKWCLYFAGRGVTYHSPNVIRHEDWQVNALYLEEFWKQQLPNLNAAPETVVVGGTEYDLIKVPRLKGFYRHRVI
jgi:GT2 family glycosyltransferase